MNKPEVTPFDARENARQYYGEELACTEDLQTTACCTTESLPPYVRAALPEIHPEVLDKYYGCGTAFPPDIKGLTVLDVGCGSGRDSYVMAKLVGPKGFVHGIDMTATQIAVADRHRKYHADLFGYPEPNTRFVQDTIENMGEHFAPGSLDLVTSNCVFNLLARKEPVLATVFSLLRENGEFYFSDVYADRRLPPELCTHPVLHGECLGGALYLHDFLRMARRVGFADPRLVSCRPLALTNPKLAPLVGNIAFMSSTYRLWKIPGLEDQCEDYGQVAVYQGGHPQGDNQFTLDREHIFAKGLPERVCGNTALILSHTRLAPYFQVSGNSEVHFGKFKGCGTSLYDRTNQESCGC